MARLTADRGRLRSPASPRFRPSIEEADLAYIWQRHVEGRPSQTRSTACHSSSVPQALSSHRQRKPRGRPRRPQKTATPPSLAGGASDVTPLVSARAPAGT